MRPKILVFGGAWLWMVGAAAVVVACPLVCHAQTQDLSPSRMGRARRHYDAGAEHFAAGRYREARRHFEEAYRISRLPDLLFNLGKVNEKLGQNQKAAAYLERFLTEHPSVSDAPQIRADIQRLRGTPTITPDPPEPPEVPQPAGQGPRLWPPLVVAGAGGAFLIIGIGLGGAAIASANELQMKLTPGRPFDAELMEIQKRGQAQNAAAITFDVLGGVGLAAGAVWTGITLYQRRQQTPAYALPTLVPAVSAGKASLVVQGTF